MIIITDMSESYILVTMEQQGALRVKVGQKALISFDSMRHVSFEGKVSAVYSYSSNFLARIDAVNLPESILPDMTCDVAIEIIEKSNALLIPVVAFENGHVWVKQKRSIPKKISVKLGVSDGTWAEVLSGELHVLDQVMIKTKASM
jgi:hypothetical protein